MEVFFSNGVRELWNKWELRVLVLLSLAWQVILIIFGSRRKYSRGTLISTLVWLVYLSADWLATVSLGTLANSQGDDANNHVLKALWAPFLLLHLGGPDTITAYSLEDNSLWLRHLLGLGVQVSVALYVLVKSWSSSALTLIAIPVFVSGFIKYSERTWVLRSASPDQFEDSSRSAPTLQLQAPDLRHMPADSGELEFVHKGYSLFPLLKRLYANLSLRFVEGQRSYSLLVKEEKEARDINISYYAFKLVEVQLGFLYDVLYTKATMIYSLAGIIFRIISACSIVSALIAFVLVIDHNARSKTDIFITHALFIGAVCLEIYAFVSLVFSDWTMRWLTKNKSPVLNFMYSAILKIRSILPRRRRWSESMAQHNLVSFCLKDRAIKCLGTGVLSKIYFSLELYRQRTWKDVDKDLKALIFKQLKEKREKYLENRFDYSNLQNLLFAKGSYVVENYNWLIGWSFEFEFDHSLLLWHVATDICYNSTPEEERDTKCETSNKLSNYMLYLLLARPFMLPKWIDRITHVRDTFTEAMNIFHQRKIPVKDGAEASEMLQKLYTQCQPLKLLRKEKSGKSVLLEGCRLASELLQNKLGGDSLWEMICNVWIDMLTYAASQCEWQTHAQQLRRGGELLTHVYLLMAGLGLNLQFDIGRWAPPIENQNEVWGCVRSKLLPIYL